MIGFVRLSIWSMDTKNTRSRDLTMIILSATKWSELTKKLACLSFNVQDGP